MSNHPLQQDNSVSIDAPLRNGQTMGSLATSNLEGAVNGSTILLQSTITTSQANPHPPSQLSTDESLPESNSLTSEHNSPLSVPNTQITASSPIARALSTTNGVASRRFYNSRLRSVYASCAFPTKTASVDSASILSSTYSKHTVQRSSWKQTIHIPPKKILHTTSYLSSPFSALVSTANVVAPVANKRVKTNDNAPPPTAPPPLDVEKRKKPPPFKRQTDLTGNLRTFKVRMIPTREQVIELKRCFSACRRAYNWALSNVKNENAAPNAIELRNAFRKEAPPVWASGKQAVNSIMLAGAVKQVADAYSSNFAKKRKDPSHQFEIKFRSTRRTPSEVIKLQKDPPSERSHKQSPLLRFEADEDTILNRGRKCCFAYLGSNLKATGGIRLQDKPHVIDRMIAEGNRLKEDAKIIFDKRTNAFHFIYTFEQPKLDDPDPAFTSKRIVANDPGVHPFQKWYSPTSGEHGELLEGFREQLEERVLKLDALQSRIDRKQQARKKGEQPTGCKQNRSRRQRYNTERRLNRKLARDRRRQCGWTESAHYDAANFMLNQYDIIVQPKLHVASLTLRSGRNLKSKTARAMLTMSHYMYRQRLQWASSRYAGRCVFETEEPGTSKTCTSCGFWHANLQLNDKTFVCPKCQLSVDRDIAGARNNFFAAYGNAIGIGWDGISN